jgi:hypothetical protein
MDCFILISHICIKDKDHQMSLKRHTKPFDLMKLCLFYSNIFIFHDLSSFTMAITNLKVSISCNNIINSYNKKIVIPIL